KSSPRKRNGPGGNGPPSKWPAGGVPRREQILSTNSRQGRQAMRRGKFRPGASKQPALQPVPVWCEDETLATLTHDLRNSLASITSALHILRMQRYPNAVAEQAGKTIERQAEHLSLLADHLSELAGVPKVRTREADREQRPVGDQAQEMRHRRILVVDD